MIVFWTGLGISLPTSFSEGQRIWLVCQNRGQIKLLFLSTTAVEPPRALRGCAGDGVGAGGWGGDGGLIIMIGTCERGLGQVHGPYQRGSARARCDLTVIRCQNEMVAL